MHPLASLPPLSTPAWVNPNPGSRVHGGVQSPADFRGTSSPSPAAYGLESLFFWTSTVPSVKWDLVASSCPLGDRMAPLFVPLGEVHVRVCPSIPKQPGGLPGPEAWGPTGSGVAGEPLQGSVPRAHSCILPPGVNRDALPALPLLHGSFPRKSTPRQAWRSGG